jgi:flagellar hook assembly protein FlgD
VAPGESGWFSLDVTVPSELLGDTTSLGQRTLLVAGHVGGYPLVADTAVLNLTLTPTFSIHNFPNPFSDHTAFVIGLPDNGKASLTVYTRAGERVCRVLENADMTTGVHVVRWDGVNDNGRSIAPGTYEYLLDYVHAGKTERIRKKLVVTRE